MLVLVLEKFSGWRRCIQRDELGWLRRVEGLPLAAHQPWLGLSVGSGRAVAVSGDADELVAATGLWLLSLSLHLLVLLYSLGRGRGDVGVELGEFRAAWRRGALQAAYHVAERDLGIQSDSEAELLGWDIFSGKPVRGSLMAVFGYALLGLVVAFAYRLLVLTIEGTVHPKLRKRTA